MHHVCPSRGVLSTDRISRIFRREASLASVTDAVIVMLECLLFSRILLVCTQTAAINCQALTRNSQKVQPCCQTE